MSSRKPLYTFTVIHIRACTKLIQALLPAVGALILCHYGSMQLTCDCLLEAGYLYIVWSIHVDNTHSMYTWLECKTAWVQVWDVNLLSCLIEHACMYVMSDITKWWSSYRITSRNMTKSKTLLVNDRDIVAVWHSNSVPTCVAEALLEVHKLD